MKSILVCFLFTWSVFSADEVQDDFITDVASATYQLTDEVAVDALFSVWKPKTYSASDAPYLYQNRLHGQHPEVNTTHGRIKGFVTVTSRKGKEYAAFLGIPYAIPPLGNLRFKVKSLLLKENGGKQTFLGKLSNTLTINLKVARERGIYLSIKISGGKWKRAFPDCLSMER